MKKTAFSVQRSAFSGNKIVKYEIVFNSTLHAIRYTLIPPGCC
ncbi:MAG: hypothetical protein WCQ90_00195 [Deltaproteobacteria bacterium]